MAPTSGGVAATPPPSTPPRKSRIPIEILDIARVVVVHSLVGGPTMPSLRDSILEKAAIRAADEASAGALVVLGSDDGDLTPATPSTPLPLDPEASEALARSKLLEFSNDELTMLKGLSVAAMQKILSNGADKDKVSVAKLVIALQKLETEKYVELRAQAVAAQGKPGTTLNVFADADFLGRVAASAGAFRAKLGAAPVVAEVIQ